MRVAIAAQGGLMVAELGDEGALQFTSFKFGRRWDNFALGMLLSRRRSKWTRLGPVRSRGVDFAVISDGGARGWLDKHIVEKIASADCSYMVQRERGKSLTSWISTDVWCPSGSRMTTVFMSAGVAGAFAVDAESGSTAPRHVSDREGFRFYVVQDALYLRDFARALAVCAAKAPAEEDIEMFCQHAAGRLRWNVSSTKASSSNSACRRRRSGRRGWPRLTSPTPPTRDPSRTDRYLLGTCSLQVRTACRVETDETVVTSR